MLDRTEEPLTAAQTSMLHVRIADQLKTEATKKLADVGLTVSDAARILMIRVAKEAGLPAGLTADPNSHDAWFRRQVQIGLDAANAGQLVPTEEVEAEPAAWRAQTRLKLLNPRMINA